MRRCTSRAPASRSSATMRGVVVPRTIESSTTMTRWPRRFSTTGLNFSCTPRIAHLLIGADERASDVAVLDQPFDVRQAAFGGVADAAGDRRVGHGHHDVGIDRMFARQLHAPSRSAPCRSSVRSSASRAARSRCTRTCTAPASASSIVRLDRLAARSDRRSGRSRRGSISRRYCAPIGASAHDSDATM